MSRVINSSDPDCMNLHAVADNIYLWMDYYINLHKQVMSAQYTSLKRGVNADVEQLWQFFLYPNDHFSDQRNTFICCLWILNTYSLRFPFWKSFQDRHDYRNKAIQKRFCNKQSYHNAAWWIQLCVLNTPPLMGVRNHLHRNPLQHFTSLCIFPPISKLKISP